MDALTRHYIRQILDNRPYFDFGHGRPHIKDECQTLPVPLEDEYFRHLQWAHFASGGAGGGMRWPNGAQC